MMNLNSSIPMFAVNLAADSKEYASICDTRSRMKCRSYKITDQITLDFWGKNEWEFTLGVPANDPNAKKYEACLYAMSAYLNRNNPTLSRLPRLVSYCKLIAERVC